MNKNKAAAIAILITRPNTLLAMTITNLCTSTIPFELISSFWYQHDMKLFSIWSRINNVKLFKEVHFATLDMTKQKRGHTLSSALYR